MEQEDTDVMTFATEQGGDGWNGGTRKTATSGKNGTVKMRMAKGITIDSGAADNVMPRRLVRGKFNKIRPSPGSRSGLHYLAANNPG